MKKLDTSLLMIAMVLMWIFSCACSQEDEPYKDNEENTEQVQEETENTDDEEIPVPDLRPPMYSFIFGINDNWSSYIPLFSVPAEGCEFKWKLGLWGETKVLEGTPNDWSEEVRDAYYSVEIYSVNISKNPNIIENSTDYSYSSNTIYPTKINETTCVADIYTFTKEIQDDGWIYLTVKIAANPTNQYRSSRISLTTTNFVEPAYSHWMGGELTFCQERSL